MEPDVSANMVFERSTSFLDMGTGYKESDLATEDGSTTGSLAAPGSNSSASGNNLAFLTVDACKKCKKTQSQPSIADGPRATTRAWGYMNGTGPHCKWCRRLSEKMSETLYWDMHGVIVTGTQQAKWDIHLSSLESLVAEGRVQISGVMIASRVDMFIWYHITCGTQITVDLLLNVKGSVTSLSGPAISAYRDEVIAATIRKEPLEQGQPAVGSSTALPSSVAGGDSFPFAATTGHVKVENQNAASESSGSGLTRSSDPAAASTIPEACQPIPRHGTVAPAADSQLQGGQQKSLRRLRSDSSNAINPLTVAAKLPGGKAGDQLAKMRITVNGYVCYFALHSWKVDFKISSVKALVKRMKDARQGIENERLPKLVTAHSELTERLNAAVLLRKIIGRVVEQEKEDDCELNHVESCCDTLLPYLQYQGKKFCGEVQSIYYRSIFFNMFKSSGSTYAALGTLQLEGLTDCFLVIRDEDMELKEVSPEDALHEVHKFIGSLLDTTVTACMTNLPGKTTEEWQQSVKLLHDDIEVTMFYLCYVHSVGLPFVILFVGHAPLDASSQGS